ncbi:MAG: nucleotidyltransferase domain-containing protein [Thermofilaceae archaeon]
MVEKITSVLKVDAIVLFGSRARGDYKPWSDYDILVLADFEEKYLDRIGRIFEITKDLTLNIEPHPYTLEEAIEMLKKGNPIIVDALSEGVVLYASERFSRLVEVYRELVKRGLRKTETSVIVPQ